MTSTANQQTSNPATTTSATAASYASAASAPKKPAPQQPVVVGGSQPAVVVSSSASPASAQNAQSVSPAPVNGKPAVVPALPAVARSSNGAHTRHSSVTMASNGPNSFAANGGSVGNAKSGIQFGFNESPAIAHSTPQTGNSAPIPIPPGANPRVASPAHSPSPIPQPSASGGGRPPSGLQAGGTQMTFGSLSSDGERHMRQGSIPPNHNAPAHFRRESNHSIQSDHAGRGNFVPQGGRGRGGFNPHGNNYNNQLGFPPNNQFRNNGQGRGMPPAFQPQPRNIPYPNSPQPHHRSPAPVHSLPGTPNMAPANLQPNIPMQTPPQHHYGAPMPPYPQQTYGFPPGQMDAYGRGGYPYNVPYMGPPQNGSPNFNQGFVQHYPPQHKHATSMSRTPSQPERPPSANQQGPVIAMGSNTKQPTPVQTQSLPFQRPKKSGAIPIKAPGTGEVLDTEKFKVPASPAPSSQHARTPPVATSTPTPPPGGAHSRTDSAVVPKTAKEIQDELKEKIKQATMGNQAAAQAAPQPAPQPAPQEAPQQAPPEPAVEAPASTPAPAEPAAPVEPPKEEAPAPAPEEPKSQEPEKPQEEDEEDEIERAIREMEEADAAREKEQEEISRKKAEEKAAAKAKEDADRKANAADEDRKLREQEREMERLEEEKEKKRLATESSGKAFSVADALAGREPPKVDAVADKLASLKLGGEKQPADGPKTTAEKRGAKPAALNLAPLNTKPVEPAQPSAALQSLKSARFLKVIGQDIYPEGIKSPNPALNAAVASKGKTFKYDASFLLQFQKVFTEQPSLEFHQQVKSLIGDNDGGRSASGRAQTPGSARTSSRGGGANFNMGAFSNAPPGGRTLPTGTSSAERFAMSSGALPRPGVNSMSSFRGPAGAFPMGASMSRTGSQSNMGPNSPRQSSRRQQGGSRREQANAAQAAKTMPLTAGMEIKPIAVSSTGWKPTSVGKGAGAAGGNAPAHMDPEMVQRKVKAALNKMTPENFERISEQILVITSQSKDETDGRTLRQVIQLTFEKATDEAHWASMYAKFCKKMLETMSADIKDERIKDKNGNVVSGGPLFRKYLLNRCQEEFERGWASETPEGEESAEKKPGEAAMLSDEYYAAAAAKRRGLGLVQFIGELYKLGMLTERIMLECVHKLVDHKGVPDEAEIESLSKLLRTIGAHLDQSEKGRPMMDVYFGRINAMVDSPELASRMKFMLMDVVDLRNAKWQSKEANKGPKTLDEVRAEAEAAQAAKAQESARNNQRGGGGGRPQAGRGDARNFSAGYQQQTSNQVGIDDLRRLKGSANRTSSGNLSLGPQSMLASRSNSGRRLGPGGSLGRPGEESGNSSRTGTPPVRENSTNAFSLLANMDNENPASPPSTAASPSISKAVPDSDKKDGE